MEKMPETKMATRRDSRRGSDAEVDAVRPSDDTCPGLPGSVMRRRRWARTGVANTGRAREDAQPDAVAEGPAEKASMAVASAEEGEVEDANACCCWSRRSSRGRDGDAGDVVVLDEARRGIQTVRHKAE